MKCRLKHPVPLLRKIQINLTLQIFIPRRWRRQTLDPAFPALQDVWSSLGTPFYQSQLLIHTQSSSSIAFPIHQTFTSCSQPFTKVFLNKNLEKSSKTLVCFFYQEFYKIIWVLSSFAACLLSVKEVISTLNQMYVSPPTPKYKINNTHRNITTVACWNDALVG